MVGFQAPAILLMAFVPMFLVAGGYYYMNRADPDCGTSFSWVTRAMGPQLGWMAGWAIVVADVIVMANLAQIAGLYTFLLFDANSLADSTFWVTFVGVIWIIIMTAIVTIGIELSARTQVGLLGAEIITLAAFAVVALVKVYAGSAPSTSVHPSFSWINPLEVSTTAISSGLLLAVFIYWGWDTTATVNEETEDSTEAPGKATVVSTLILLGIYIIVAVAAMAYAGLGELRHNKDDVLSALGNEVFGSPLDKILIIAVLTSAAASTQTTILPTARTTLSMARARAMPSALGRVHPRFLTPAVSTILMGVASIVWYVSLTILSEDILFDSLAALGLMISFYYRAHRIRMRDLLPARAAQQRQEFLLHRRRAGGRRGDPLLSADQERDRAQRPGQLGVGQLVVRDRTAAGDRDLLRRAGDPADAVAMGSEARVLPAGDRRPSRRSSSQGLPLQEGAEMAGIVVGYDGTDSSRRRSTRRSASPRTSASRFSPCSATG